jgi:tyrosinase
MAGVRKNQSRLSASEWQAFITAIDAIRKPQAGKPRYQDFVAVHNQGMVGRGMHTWGVHTMGPGPMRGRNFLAWHRWFLLQFERRLRQEEPGVTVPYWDWMSYRRLPVSLNHPAQLRRWRLTRQWDNDFLPTRAEITATMRRRSFAAFQSRLEGLHGGVHIGVGGQMATARSPADPLFWLHHANIDRLWASWQQRHAGQRAKNRSEVLKPKAMFGVTVSEVWRISKLGYRYR